MKDIEETLLFLRDHSEDKECREPTAKKLWKEKQNELSEEIASKYQEYRSGKELFQDVMQTIKNHFYLPEEWHYVITSLFVFEAKIPQLLPAVFYICFGGQKGSGKTNLLDLLRGLTSGLIFENVSITALARSMKNGLPVFIDEVDADRGKEYNEIRDSLLRQGYKRNAAPYTRYDIGKKGNEEIPIYGAKCLTYRSYLDDALKDRAFIIPTAKVKGEDGYSFVLANLWPKIANLPGQLDLWATVVMLDHSSEELEYLANSDRFREDMKRAVQELGANRESELVTIALLVADIVGVDIAEELEKATKLRLDSSEGISDQLEEVIPGNIGPCPAQSNEDSGRDAGYPNKTERSQKENKSNEKGTRR